MLKTLVVALCALLAVSGAAEAKPRKKCRAGSVRVELPQAKQRCVKVATLSAGVPRDAVGRNRRLLELSRAPDAWSADNTAGFASVLGSDAVAAGGWEDAVYARALESFPPAARTARLQAAGGGGSDGLAIGVDGPLGWAASAKAKVSEAQKDLAGPTRETQVEGQMTAEDNGRRYSIKVDESMAQGKFCPTEAGIVRATGYWRVTRIADPAGDAPLLQKQEIAVNYVVTGHVGKDGRLKNYDLDVLVGAFDNGIQGWEARARIKGIAPGKDGARPQVLSRYPATIKVTQPHAPQPLDHVAAAQAEMEQIAWVALERAHEDGNRFLHEAEGTYFDKADCIDFTWTPSDLSDVKPGETKLVRVTLKSEEDGERVEQDLKAKGKGGTKVSPSTLKPDKKKAGKAKVTAPKKGRNKVMARLAGAGTEGAALEVEGVSERGRSFDRLTLGSQQLEYRVTAATASYDFDYDDGCLKIRDHQEYSLGQGAEPILGGDFMLGLIPLNGTYNSASTDCNAQPDRRECSRSGAFDSVDLFPVEINHLDTGSPTADVYFRPFNRSNLCAAGVNDPHFDQRENKWTVKVPWQTVQGDAPFTLEGTKTYSAPGQGSGTHRASVTLQRLR